MKKLLLTCLTLLLFVGYGFSQNSSRAKMVVATKAPVVSMKTTNVNPEVNLENFEGEQAFMDNLKNTDAALYEQYLKERLDVKSLNKCLLNKNLSATEKTQLEAKLNAIETKYSLK